MMACSYGCFKRAWKVLIASSASTGTGCVWTARLTRHRLGGKKTGKNPMDRGKLGVKRSVLIEGHGVPVNVVVAGANRHDSVLLEPTLSTLPIARPVPETTGRQHMCLDKGYSYPFVREMLAHLQWVAHVRPKCPWGQATTAPSMIIEHAGASPRRWKVERTISWFNRFRSLLIRWSKKPQNHLALIHFAASAIALQHAYTFADCLLG